MTDENDPQTLRLKMINRRKAMLARSMPPASSITVWPSNDDVRQCIQHPTGIGFPDSGSANWPDDQFTRLRLADGSVTIAEGASAAGSSFGTSQ